MGREVCRKHVAEAREGNRGKAVQEVDGSFARERPLEQRARGASARLSNPTIIAGWSAFKNKGE